MNNLRRFCHATPPLAEVVGPYHSGQEQHGGQFHRHQVRSEERQTNLFGCDHGNPGGLTARLGQDVEQQHHQDTGENARANPHLWP